MHPHFNMACMVMILVLAVCVQLKNLLAAQVLHLQIQLDVDSQSDDDDSTLHYLLLLLDVYTRAERARRPVNRKRRRADRVNDNSRGVWYRFPKSVGWWHDVVLTHWQDSMFISNFRFSRSEFFVLLRSLEPHLTGQQSRFQAPQDPAVKLAACLMRLAHGTQYRMIGHLLGIGASSVVDYVKAVCDAIIAVHGHLIRFPTGPELKALERQFWKMQGMPNCFGAIDCTHIQIPKPRFGAAAYYDREGNYSIIIQAVVGPKYEFLDVSVGSPGSLADIRVLRNSALYDQMEFSKLGMEDIELHPDGHRESHKR